MSGARSGGASLLQRELARFRTRWMNELSKDEGEQEQGRQDGGQTAAAAREGDETAPDLGTDLGTAQGTTAQDSDFSLSQLGPLPPLQPQQDLGVAEAASTAPSALYSERATERREEVKPLLVIPARAREAATARETQQGEQTKRGDRTDKEQSPLPDGTPSSSRASEGDTLAAKRPKASFSKRADIFSKAWRSPFEIKREQRRRVRGMQKPQPQKEEPRKPSAHTVSPERLLPSAQAATTRAGQGQARSGTASATTAATASATTAATASATTAATASATTAPLSTTTATAAVPSARRDTDTRAPTSAEPREKRRPRPQNEFVKMLIDDINDDITEPLFDELLPLEVAEIVFRYLDLQTLGRCALVSRAWRDLADSNRVWYAYAVANGITRDRFTAQDNWKAFVRRYILDKREKRRRWMELQTAFICLKDTASTTDVTAVSYTPRGVAAGYSDGQVRFFARENLMRSRMVEPCGRDAGAVACIDHTDTAMACGTVCGRLVGWDHGFGKSFVLRHSNMLHRVAICERSSRPRVLAASGQLLLAAQRDADTMAADAEHEASRGRGGGGRYRGRGGRQPLYQREGEGRSEERGGDGQREGRGGRGGRGGGRGTAGAGTCKGWRFQEHRYDSGSFVTDVVELPLAEDAAAVLSARCVDIINTASMTTMHNIHRSASGPSAQKCSALQCCGAHLGFLTSEPGHWSARLVDVASGTVVQTYSQFRHSLSSLQLVQDPSASAAARGAGAAGSSAPALEMAMAGSCGVLFYDARTRDVSQHIRTSGYLCRDVRVDDWRVVVSGRSTGPTGRQPPFSVALYDRRMGKQLWFVRQSVPVRFLEMDTNTIVFGSHRHRDARFTTPLSDSLGHHRPRRPQLRDLDAMSCLNVLDFAAPLSSLTDEECPFSSKYEDLHGYSYNIVLETPFDDVQPYKLG